MVLRALPEKVTDKAEGGEGIILKENVKKKMGH